MKTAANRRFLFLSLLSTVIINCFSVWAQAEIHDEIDILNPVNDCHYNAHTDLRLMPEAQAKIEAINADVTRISFNLRFGTCEDSKLKIDKIPDSMSAGIERQPFNWKGFARRADAIEASDSSHYVLSIDVSIPEILKKVDESETKSVYVLVHYGFNWDLARRYLNAECG